VPVMPLSVPLARKPRRRRRRTDTRANRFVGRWRLYLKLYLPPKAWVLGTGGKLA
jgi:hypothetical protein